MSAGILQQTYTISDLAVSINQLLQLKFKIICPQITPTSTTKALPSPVTAIQLELTTLCEDPPRWSYYSRSEPTHPCLCPHGAHTALFLFWIWGFLSLHANQFSPLSVAFVGPTTNNVTIPHLQQSRWTYLPNATTSRQFSLTPRQPACGIFLHTHRAGAQFM